MQNAAQAVARMIQATPSHTKRSIAAAESIPVTFSTNRASGGVPVAPIDDSTRATSFP
jgi:hypothetical protein